MPGLTQQAAAVLLRTRSVHRITRMLARARGHRLVLVYHRIGSSSQPGCEVIPSVPADVFRAQLRALLEVVDLVSLDEVVSAAWRTRPAAERDRPAVAITFDDDLPSHRSHALPILQALGVPATFFLSGRALHGLGAYWFQQLESLVAVRGLEAARQALGLPASTVADLAFACEADAARQRDVAAMWATPDAPAVLDRAGIEALVRAGMTIGFHTLGHQRLTALDAAGLECALGTGRDALAAAAGAPLRYFAYPHGSVDARAAAAVERAGFDAAWTGRAAPLRPGDDRYQLGRWEPGPIGAGELLVKLAVRLHRAAPARHHEAR